jgi:hypothetical protein
MPRRQQLDYLGLGPHGALIYCPNSHFKGLAQNSKGTLTAGHSHRLTSGGKAVTWY